MFVQTADDLKADAKTLRLVNVRRETVTAASLMEKPPALPGDSHSTAARPVVEPAVWREAPSPLAGEGWGEGRFVS
jgi:hypothetical protein